jgi:choline dehydrogenase-like flavoprotein
VANQGWGYADLLPLIKRLANFEPRASKYHGSGGPVNVADLRDPNSLSLVFVQACQQSGLELNADQNGACQEGFGLYRVTQKNGARDSSDAAYLKPAFGRANLRIETDALATALLFDGNRCIGVSYTQNGNTVEARANREVIVSGGAVNSPQLLMVSGIGRVVCGAPKQARAPAAVRRDGREALLAGHWLDARPGMDDKCGGGGRFRGAAQQQQCRRQAKNRAHACQPDTRI